MAMKNENQAAMALLEELQKKLETLSFSITSTNSEKKPKIEDWIYLSWCMEKELIVKSIRDIKEQIINQDYDY